MWCSQGQCGLQQEIETMSENKCVLVANPDKVVLVLDVALERAN